jgi:hypothetical protein
LSNSLVIAGVKDDRFSLDLLEERPDAKLPRLQVHQQCDEQSLYPFQTANATYGMHLGFDLRVCASPKYESRIGGGGSRIGGSNLQHRSQTQELSHWLCTLILFSSQTSESQRVVSDNAAD